MYTLLSFNNHQLNTLITILISSASIPPFCLSILEQALDILSSLKPKYVSLEDKYTTPYNINSNS